MKLKINFSRFPSFMGANLFKRVALLLIACLSEYNAFAQSSGVSSALSGVASEISGYQSSVKSILYAIAGIIALVGAFNIFHKMNNGDQDVKKTIMLTIGGCISFIALANALPGIFK